MTKSLAWRDAQDSGMPSSAFRPSATPSTSTTAPLFFKTVPENVENIPMHAFSETQKEWLRTDVPPFRAGDTVRVNVRVKEGDKERVQAFEGVCIARRGAGVSASFTVRKISNGVGVERIFPLHSPMLADIAVVRRGRVRRAKLFYLRALTGKATRIKERKVKPATAPAANA